MRGPRKKRKIALIVIPVVAAGTILGVQLRGEGNPYASSDEPTIAAPAAYTTSLWDDTLGGDEGITPERLKDLGDLKHSDLGDAAPVVANIAKQLTIADLVGEGRGAYPSYWVDPATASASCTSVQVQAVSPMLLPTVNTNGEWSKTLVAYTGTCNGETTDTQVTYVYAQKDGKDWKPVREWSIPGSTTLSDPNPLKVPNEWEVSELTDCAPVNTRMRIVAAKAWDLMCQDAKKENVDLEATVAYRSPSDQQKLYQEAVKHYGSDEEARKYVSYSNGTTCASRHCSGMAVDIAPGPGRIWAHATIGCSDGKNVQLGPTTCAAGLTKVERMQRYGFVSTSPGNPGHLESTLPVTTDDNGNDCHPVDDNIPQMVASIFRCRLQNAGVDPAVINDTTAQAVTISQCESAWNPSALAQGGRYRTQADPITGRLYTEAGVFMIDQPTAEGWVPGGYDKVNDAVSNINGAASIWLAQRNWDTFGCATGQGVGYQRGPVLPQHGGPEIPLTSYEY